jgi:ABC-2 type transport system permease protein
LPLYLIELPYFYGLPRLGGVIPILIFAVPFVLSVSGLGLVVAAIFKNPLSVQLVLAAIGMPFFFLAGFAWPAEVIPPAVHVASLLVPSTSATNGFTWLAQLGAPLADVRGEFLMLWGLTIRRYRLDPGSQEAVDRTAETRESLWHDIDGLHVFVEQIRNGFSSGKIS